MATVLERLLAARAACNHNAHPANTATYRFAGNDRHVRTCGACGVVFSTVDVPGLGLVSDGTWLPACSHPQSEWVRTDTLNESVTRCQCGQIVAAITYGMTLSEGGPALEPIEAPRVPFGPHLPDPDCEHRPTRSESNPWWRCARCGTELAVELFGSADGLVREIMSVGREVRPGIRTTPLLGVSGFKYKHTVGPRAVQSLPVDDPNGDDVGEDG